MLSMPLQVCCFGGENPDITASSAYSSERVAKPGTHSYTLLVTKSGVFQWHCNYPCDPYSMMHDGYMRGTITSV